MPSSLRYSTLLIASVLAAGGQTLLENDQVRVLKATDQPHVKTKPHEHKVNRVMIYLQSGRQEITSGGKTITQEWKAGDVKFTPASPTHVAEIVSGEPVTMIEVELKKPGNPNVPTTALDPLKVAPNLYHLAFENPQVRVLRIHFAPKQKVPLHEHLLNRVTVFLTDYDGATIVPGAQPVRAVRKAGEAAWGTPTKHTEENYGDTPMDSYMIELKN